MSRKITFYNLIMTILVIAFAFNSCNNNDGNVQRFRDAALNLDNTRHTLVDEFDYWPECAIRVTGSHLASLISLSDLREMLPCPLYVSGPHHDGKWDLDNENNFGHYNPQAIQYLADLAKKVVADKSFVNSSKPLVDKYLYRQMHIMMVLHDAIYSEELFDKDAREYILEKMIETKGSTAFDDTYYFMYSLRLEDDSYVYGNTGNQFLYFWARRWKDGTIDQFYQGLSTIFKAYYPEYAFSMEKYWIEWEEDWDGEWYEGDDWEGDATSYNCDLDSDEPVQKSERIGQQQAIDLIKSAVEDLDDTRHVLADEYDYWPNCGLRVTGSHLFSLISLKTLNKMLPCDLYLSGPHHYNRWELNSDDFGHYNPEAVKYLNQLASKVVSDKKFVEKTKPLIDKYLKAQMFSMMAIYDGLNDKNICGNKKTILDNSMELKGQTYFGTLGGSFIDRLTNIDEGNFEFSYTPEMMLYFWARRNADGTMELFHDGLKTVFMTYYPEYNYQQIIGQNYSDRVENLGDFSDSYVVIDGSELRLRLSPSTSAETFKWPDGSNRHPIVGERYRYLDETDDFFQIDFNGNALWVSKQFTHIE